MTPARPLKSVAAVAALLTLPIGSGAAWANTPAPVLGTGQGLTPGSRDPSWSIVAAPDGFASPEPLPYDAFVIGDTIIAGSTLTVNGITYHSISPSTNGETGFAYGTNVNWVFVQNFEVPEAGTYQFKFQTLADNGLTLYLNGTIDSSDPLMPTISGGTLIGEVPGFSQLYTISKTIALNPGVHRLFGVLYDFGPPTSFILAAPPTDVPTPLPLLGAASALVASRRLKRRIRLAHPRGGEA